MHCIDQQFPISKLWITRNAINESPEYQRESAVWSKDKQQLFIDSILNRFDVPKLYFHDLRGSNGLHEFAVVDGKQRLHAIFEFMQGMLKLADDFALIEARTGQDAPAGGSKFTDMSEYWREEFKGTSLSVVLIQNAGDDDIEELFSRLNNGEPLNAAEKRNAMGGEMSKLIREVAKDKWFSENLKIKNSRFQHLEIAAKVLRLEEASQAGSGMFADLKKKFLDEMVSKSRNMSAAARDGLLKRVSDQLSAMRRVFKKADPLLSKQAYPPLYYIFVKKVLAEYADPALYTKIRSFLEKFQADRLSNLDKAEEQRDNALIEFGRLMQQGTNDLNSLRERTATLVRYFLLEYPDVQLKDTKRAFTDEERLAIWILGGKKCAMCGIEVELDEMHADHQIQWSHGGVTSLKNGRCLCVQCNTSAAKKVS
ncbi:GmrSD restriction endonuclease domain-containing protein [Frateuria aurantia]|uniref:HNH nuclease domain-containing protein n=1 Tax=Frateuria aurantia (strain ATCC 33424 / DSM 6220 / KCTC 2777 / LMG 1558 / NBRC 3245 / NCIMB 13370) TaxID=767434 RepID=H8L6X3_FRAAD|nr:DUF262 domain-containing protein [Frateuria aurantia]AFC86883.1 Protein of unknown function DUF262/HNH endonuclease [Frateuria aurantia DSM 6220]